MAISVGTPPMNRTENLAALEMILGSMSGLNPESQSMENLRRTAYLHVIVEAVLNEQVNRLREATEMCSRLAFMQ